MMKGKKYSALEIMTAAFPEGVQVQVGEEPHIVTAEDVAANPGVPEMVEGAEILLPTFEVKPLSEVFGKYGIVIGGLSGIVDPEHKIMISEASTELIVSVGITHANVPLEDFVEEAPVEAPAEAVAAPAPTPEQ